MGGENLEAGNIAFSFKKFIFKNETEGDGIEPPLNCAGDRGLIWGSLLLISRQCWTSVLAACLLRMSPSLYPVPLSADLVYRLRLDLSC